ncbi:MAG: tRNA (adenosine(37)-N6)-threonylcarbamoyltransferase complex ATPase subunit type 1 TsaE [Burkholderiales bacterium PBB3]|nr:MAG: tRNA (adenosine(37)-N6)-threonylcarbamoyltransferase complex ATPase subunit type 1 TsaE [Burkholderiales bacterium PBB3]
MAWPDEDATRAFAQGLAAHPALAHASICLHGDLGAGKTTLVRHLLQALGVTGRIKSPTYAVVEPYELPELNIWHFDFYRFADPREWEDAGVRDIFASPGLKLSEWPEKAGAALPLPDLDIVIAVPTPEAWEAERFASCPPPALRAPPLPAQNAQPAKLLPDNARLVTLTARTATGLALLDTTGAPA